MNLSRKSTLSPPKRLRCAALGVVVLLAGRAIALEQSTAAPADSTEVETRVKAAFIYNFARFVAWPPRSNAGPVRIGVMGRGDLTAPLEDAVRGKSVGGRTIQITPVENAGEAESCEILLIERSESKHSREIAEALAGKPVLTVSDEESGSKDGIMIAFQLVDESVRFRINQEAAERAGLKISSQLLKVAIPSKGKRE